MVQGVNGRSLSKISYLFIGKASTHKLQKHCRLFLRTQIANFIPQGKLKTVFWEKKLKNVREI